MRGRVFCIVLLWLGSQIKAQTLLQTDSGYTSAKHTVYGELFGASDIYSLGYQFQPKLRSVFSIGAGWLPGTWQLNGLNNRSFLYIPITVGYVCFKQPHQAVFSGHLLNTYTFYQNAPNHLRTETRVGISYLWNPKTTRVFAKAGLVVRVPLYFSADVYDYFFYTGTSWLLWPQVATGVKF